MRKYIKTILLTFVITSMLISCGKDKTPPNAAIADCLIKTAVVSSSNSASAEYIFDSNNNLSSVKELPSGRTVNIGSNTVTNNYTYLDRPAWNLIKYDVSDITQELPVMAFVSINDGQITTVNYETYFFFFDDKDQLVKVGQQTDNIKGDWEYDLDIYYNTQGNVTGLQYKWTTGPNQVIPPVTVTAYDDKPNPYSGVKAWRFISANWNSSDPASIITALSKNNPLNYSMGSGSSLFKREMVYQYNDKGFPIERKNTNTSATGQYTFLETFSYNCH
jgi:hypothetical protein